MVANGEPRLRIRLAGVFGVEAGGAVLSDRELGSRKARTLLKLLAVRRGHVVPADTITEALWGDDVPRKPAENIATLVSRLRSVLGSGVIAGGRDGYRLVIGGGHGALAVDVDDAESLVAEAEARLSAAEPGLAAAAANRALDLIPGRLLEDEPDSSWADDARRSLESLRRRARCAAWRAALEAGDTASAVRAAGAAVDDDALDEEAHRAIIDAHHRAGQPGEALAAYERLRVTLVEELGADPAPETQELYLAVLRAERPSADGATAPRPTTIPRTVAADFVGREHELQALVDAWEAAAGGTPGCLIVTGQAGIGKTRLTLELASVAGATGGEVVHVRCYETERSLFLEPVVEAVRSLAVSMPPAELREVVGEWAGTLAGVVPEVGEVLRPHRYEPAAPELERRRIFEAVTALVRSVARRRPLLIVLDDLHSAGESTRELLHFSLRRIVADPLLVVGTVRSEDDAAVRRELGDVASVIDVQPLAPDAVAALAASMGVPHLGDDVMRLTRGHTLFAVEALRAAAEAGGSSLTVPDSLRAAVLARAARCGGPAEELLRVAAVAGTAFGLDVVAALLGTAPRETAANAERALAVGLLVEAGTGYEFANDLVRDVLYDATPLPTRTILHRRLSELLADRPEAAAEHAAAAGDWRRAVETWLAAAVRATSTFANREAVELLGRAKDGCTRLDDPVLTARVNIASGGAHLALADYAAASADLAIALQLAHASGESLLESEATERLGWVAYFTGDTARARELTERLAAADEIDSAPDSPNVRRALVLVGRVRHTQGDLAGARAALEPLVSSGDAETSAVGMSYLGALLEHMDRFDEAAAMLERAVDVCRRHGALRAMLNAVFFGGMAHANRGDLEVGLRWFERLDKEASELDASYYRTRAATSLAWVWRELGEAGRARDLAEEAVEVAESAGPHSGQDEPWANALLGLAESAILAGDDGGAARHLTRVDHVLGLGGVRFAWRTCLRRDELWGQLERDRAEGLLESARAAGSPKYEALALARLDRIDEALAVAASTGSDLLLSRVAPPALAAEAVDRIANRLSPDLRELFIRRGPAATRRRH